MADGSFSLTEKLAVTGAFLALVALVVGTEDDPGVVVTGQEVVKELRPAAPAQPTTSVLAIPESGTEVELPSAPSLPDSEVPDVIPMPLQEEAGEDDGDGQFSPELGRVPRDFSNGPPAT